ncbi:MAG: VOC family protein [Candidatus Poribacteria bacterium]|nr:VOC family protein [Candidatus Poribacteria bacterium]
MENAAQKVPAILERFIADATRIAAAEPNRARTIEEINPLFAELLADETFLAEEYKQVIPHKFAQYALYRAADRSLSIMSMVVPPGTATPVHDHLAWGLVGVYQGVQKETIYQRMDEGRQPGFAELEQIGARVLHPGDITTLLPPDGDIHRIETISEEPSISIHVLGNDIGCELRHAYNPAQKSVRSFRSGYQNVPCLQARFDHQHLIVENVEETVAFYEAILGAQKIQATEMEGVPVVLMDMNGMRLVISRQMLPNIGSHYGLAVDDLETAVEELKSRGVEFLTEPAVLGKVKYVFIQDAAGNAVELVERRI